MMAWWARWATRAAAVGQARRHRDSGSRAAARWCGVGAALWRVVQGTAIEHPDLPPLGLLKQAGELQKPKPDVLVCILDEQRHLSTSSAVPMKSADRHDGAYGSGSWDGRDRNATGLVDCGELLRLTQVAGRPLP